MTVPFPTAHIVIALGGPLARSGAQRGPGGPRASGATPSSGPPKATAKRRAAFRQLPRYSSVTRRQASLPPRALHSAKIGSVTMCAVGKGTVTP